MIALALQCAAIALLAAFITGAVWRYALHRLLDLPNARSSHRTPTPRGGGLAIVAAFSLALLYLYFSKALPFELLMALAALLPLAAIGFLDDHGHVPARWRFLLQMSAAAWALFWMGGFSAVALAGQTVDLGWAGNVLGALFIVWLLNLFNFMDGIDGIAGVETITMSTSAAVLMGGAGEGAWPGAPQAALVLAAATAGFLVWNWPPARIFMGDVGSGMLGYVLAVLALWTAGRHELSLAVWLILGGVFLVDATLTLWVRVLRGERWYEAHRRHAYQHASQRWASHKRVSVAVLTINLVWLLPLALAAVLWPRWELIYLAAAYAPLVVLAFTLGAGKSS
jgi:Fuc2NAc and GlcNAc transferase